MPGTDPMSDFGLPSFACRCRVLTLKEAAVLVVGCLFSQLVKAFEHVLELNVDGADLPADFSLTSGVDDIAGGLPEVCAFDLHHLKK